MIPLAAARALIAEKIQSLEPLSVPLTDVHRRILREAVTAPEDFPAFDRSAMDGYAVGAEDRSERYRVVGEAAPGALPGFAVRPGECARIFTGAPLPEGASRVIMQEYVEVSDGWMRPTSAEDTSSHVRKRGEDARRGDLLLRERTRIGAGEATLLAQTGKTQCLCSPRPRVLHVATGSELVDPNLTPEAGQIRDTNSTLIACLLREQNAELVGHARCHDDLQHLVNRIADFSTESWDLLLISGGASVGDHDFGKRALIELGFTVHFDAIALRPGKPLIFATRGRQAAFVLPGNPVSHFVVFHVAVRAALEALEGAAEAAWPLVEARRTGDWPAAIRPDRRETYWPGRLGFDGGELSVRPLMWQSSGDLCGLAGANALIQTGNREESAPAEGRARCLLLAS